MHQHIRRAGAPAPVAPRPPCLSPKPISCPKLAAILAKRTAESCREAVEAAAGDRGPASRCASCGAPANQTFFGDVHETYHYARRRDRPRRPRGQPVDRPERTDLFRGHPREDHHARQRRHPHRHAALPERRARRRNRQGRLRQPRLHARRAGLPHRHLRHLRPRNLQRPRKRGRQAQPGRRPDRRPDGRALPLPHAQHHHRLRLRLPRPHRRAHGPDQCPRASSARWTTRISAG